MKLFYLSIFLISVNFYAQDKTRYIEFTPVETNNEYDSINWASGNKTRHEFELKGRKPVRCELSVIANEGVVLSHFVDNRWQAIDTLGYSVFTDVTPAFTITDFNRDGNEDFMCWTHTNVNGNDWERIFLSNPNTGQLQKLRTTSDEEDVWCAPEYNSKKKIISCTLVSGIFGVSEEYTYKLDGLTALPVSKERTNNTGVRYQQYIHFKGMDGEWKITGQDILFSIPEDDDKFTWYRIRQENDSTAMIMQCPDLESTDCRLLYKAECNGWLPEYSSTDDFSIPYFSITDFNDDGYDDLLICTYGSVHAILPMRIYLFDPEKRNLTELVNFAEKDGYWMSPEYNKETKTIHCFFDTGNAGISYTSTYSLNGFNANPVKKHEEDCTNFNPITGEGYEINDYKGKNGKWKLVKTETEEIQEQE